MGLDGLKSWENSDANGNLGGVHLANLTRMLEDVTDLLDLVAMIAVDKTHAKADSLADMMADAKAGAKENF